MLGVVAAKFVLISQAPTHPGASAFRPKSFLRVRFASSGELEKGD